MNDGYNEFGMDEETVIQTVSIPNKPDNLKFYFRINI